MSSTYPVELAKFLTTLFSKNTSGGYFLTLVKQNKAVTAQENVFFIDFFSTCKQIHNQFPADLQIFIKGVLKKNTSFSWSIIRTTIVFFMETGKDLMDTGIDHN